MDAQATPPRCPNRVALITGCGKQIVIGASTARALAAAGVTVVVSDVVPTGLANEHNVQGDEHQLDVPETEGEHVVQPDRMADDLGRKAVAVMRGGAPMPSASPASPS